MPSNEQFESPEENQEQKPSEEVEIVSQIPYEARDIATPDETTEKREFRIEKTKEELRNMSGEGMKDPLMRAIDEKYGSNKSPEDPAQDPLMRALGRKYGYVEPKMSIWSRIKGFFRA